MKNLKSKIDNLQSSAKGMSLVEVVVWIGVITLLMGVMTLSIIKVYRSNSYIFERALAVLSVRKGIENATSLVREASYSESGGYPIVALGESSFTFYSDYDNDGVVEQVRVFIDGDELKRGIVEPSGSPAVYTGAESASTIVRNVRNSALGRDLFTYYDSAGVEVVNMSELLAPVFIKVDLVANTGKNPTVNDYELQGSAFMRNLKN